MKNIAINHHDNEPYNKQNPLQILHNQFLRFLNMRF